MELENKPEEPKLIFGLSPKATLINAIILSICASLFWVLKFSEQIPPDIDYANLPKDLKFTDNVPWYYDMIWSILSIVMALTWVEYKFDLKRGDYSWRAIKYKFLYCMTGIFLLQEVAKFIFLYFILLTK